MSPAPKRVMVAFGTRPEAIKMSPVVNALRRHLNLMPLVLVTAQHRSMLDQVLTLFGIQPDTDLDIMRPGQSPAEVTSAIIIKIQPILKEMKPDLVLVHGDTTTTLAVALSAFYAGIPVGHVEAGLRTHNMLAPWPEEMNRRLTAPLCALHFAPTGQARDNLLRETTVADSIHVTGNTVIDALLAISDSIDGDPALSNSLGIGYPFLDPTKRLILVTGHRRESFGPALRRICTAIGNICARDDVQVIYPVHPNPNIRNSVYERLSGIENLFLIDPQDYLPFVYLMKRAHLLLTDSGGIQEEAPSLGKPVLVMRDTTERPEAIDAGTARLVGTDPERIVSNVFELLENPASYALMSSAHNPYGDGRAGERIANLVQGFLATGVNAGSC